MAFDETTILDYLIEFRAGIKRHSPCCTVAPVSEKLAGFGPYGS
jgi:hypothetical protein